MRKYYPRAIIFLNGDKSDISRLKNYIDKEALLIGCDGGTKKLLKLGLAPHVVIGDFDSFNKKSLKSLEYVEHPTDKDYTDSEAAIKYAIEKGAKEVILTGFLGSRIDHSLGNIFLLDKPEFAGTKLKIIEGDQEIYVISGKVGIRGKKGDTISFIPIFGEVRAESSSGLKYDLAKYTLSMYGNSGISNELTADKVEVQINNQKLLVIHTKS